MKVIFFGLLTVLLLAAALLSAQTNQTFQELKANAEKGDAEAQYGLGLAYARGEGVTNNEAEATKWFRKAAEQNNADAQFTLGSYYAFGEGMAKDEVEAAK